MRRPSEHSEQVRVVRLARAAGLHVWAIPNGGYRRKVDARQLRDEGVYPGAPDLQVNTPCPYYRLVGLEMKRSDWTGADPDEHELRQAEVHAELRELGWFVGFCPGSSVALGTLALLGYGVGGNWDRAAELAWVQTLEAGSLPWLRGELLGRYELHACTDEKYLKFLW